MNRKRHKMNRRGQFGARLINGSKDLPLGIKVVSILNYVGALLGIAFGVLMLLGGSILVLISKTVPILLSLVFIVSVASSVVTAIFGLLFTPRMFIVGISVILCAVLTLFIGRGLWKAKNWARIAVIVLFCLGVLRVGLTFIQSKAVQVNGIISLVLYLLIIGYLLFSKKVKEAFA